MPINVCANSVFFIFFEFMVKNLQTAAVTKNFEWRLSRQQTLRRQMFEDEDIYTKYFLNAAIPGLNYTL